MLMHTVSISSSLHSSGFRLVLKTVKAKSFLLSTGWHAMKTGILSCHWLPCEAWRWGCPWGPQPPFRNWYNPLSKKLSCAWRQIPSWNTGFQILLCYQATWWSSLSRWLSPTVRAFEQVNLGWGLRICASNKFPVEPHFGNHFLNISIK